MNQLVAFRDGRRRYPPMNYLLEYNPRPYLQQIADYLRRVAPAAGAAGGHRCQCRLSWPAGTSLVTEGDPAHGVPACSAVTAPS